ncbi:MAG TPA: hypothetical protein VL093_02255, partial [Flavipsychrobacter sp.]|nr:hypothetical protein [Flavipsychrobacter sp.]
LGYQVEALGYQVEALGCAEETMGYPEMILGYPEMALGYLLRKLECSEWSLTHPFKFFRLLFAALNSQKTVLTT